ncbi:MAG: ArsR family transcriptional regulator [Gammaproteobacteria bacterium]|nr:ArsR family transcriptional regulator [Gammaproteobacteria bacterium]
MKSSLSELLFKDYRRHVLGLLLLNPENSYHVREIARLTGTSAGTLHKELTKLAETGLLLKELLGNQVVYQANTYCPIFLELVSIMKKLSIGGDSQRELEQPQMDALVNQYRSQILALSGFLVDVSDLVHLKVDVVTENSLHPKIRKKVLREARSL